MFIVTMISFIMGAHDVTTDIGSNLAQYDKNHNCHTEQVAYYASSEDENNCKQLE